MKQLLIVGALALSSLSFATSRTELPLTMEADSVQAKLNTILREYLAQDEKSQTPTNFVARDANGNLLVEDDKSQLSCSEQQAGLLTVQQYSCVLTIK
jgi:hypothetical protein